MANFFVGDIQGCFDELRLLLAKINFNHEQDHLYLVGDLIGRGPQAKETLDFLMQHQQSMHPVLGNHDLHFLAISQGIKQAKQGDKFNELLSSTHLSQYVDYLRNQPLLIILPEDNIVITHAGISPQWDVATAAEQASIVQNWLSGDNFITLLTTMYNNDINHWNECVTSTQRAVFTINALTRMRYCYNDGRLDFSTNCAPHKNTDLALKPWFDFNLTPSDNTLVFGHWAALLGQTGQHKIIALDTGCLWGNLMTIWQSSTNTYFNQKSLQ